MVEFVCEDCGDRVFCWRDVDDTTPLICGPCDWIRSMPEAERPDLRERLRVNTGRP